MKMNKEEKQAYNRAYNATHREEINEKTRQYRKVHREKIREKNRQYCEAHREEIKEKKRQYYEAHREEIKEKKRQYRKVHREKIKESKSIETIELLEKCAKENARKKEIKAVQKFVSREIEKQKETEQLARLPFAELKKRLGI
jgi:hypothetical protein